MLPFTALAFANNSKEQKGRKNILKKFTFPHAHSEMGNILDRLCIEECQHLNQYIKKIFPKNEKSIKVDLKPLVAKACANIFNRYFCSAKRCDFDNGDFDEYCRYIRE